jgi:hypothetical protein
MDRPRTSPIREAEERARLQYEAELKKMKSELSEFKQQSAAKSARKAKYERRFQRGSKKKKA